MRMASPLIYVAMSHELCRELLLDEQLARLEGLAQIERWPGPGNPPLEVVEEAARRAQVLLTGWGTPALRFLTAWEPETFAVRLIAHSAGTVKYLVPLEALERGLRVTHANESLAEAVAEFTLGAIILARRQAFTAAARMAANRPQVPISRQHELGGSTVGIIGASAIGRRVMRLLQPFGVTLLVYDPYCTPETAAAHQASLVELPELMRRSDIVTLHAPVTPETIGMLGAAEFAAMKAGALFVNTARGRLIDHAALLAELQSGRIHALLDVTDPTEPLPPDSPFFALENCVVFPHMAAVTIETRRRQSSIIVDELLLYLKDQPIGFEVTRARWDTMA